MPRVKIQAGMEIETLSKHELDEGLTSLHASWFQEMARGLKPMRMTPVLAPIAGGAITLTAGQAGDGPNAGFAWAIQRITVSGLATGDVLQIFRNTTDPGNFIGQASFTSPTFRNGSSGFLLKDGETVTFAAAGLTATGRLIISGEYIEAPESMIWKLL